jgi:hypothetical protein
VYLQPDAAELFGTNPCSVERRGQRGHKRRRRRRLMIQRGQVDENLIRTLLDDAPLSWWSWHSLPDGVQTADIAGNGAAKLNS